MEIIEIQRRRIKSPQLICEIKKMAEEMGLSPGGVIFQCFLDRVRERREGRSVSMKIEDDQLDINTLRYEVSKLLDKYEKRSRK